VKTFLLALFTLVMFAPTRPVTATEVLTVEVSVEGSIYHLRGESIIRAPAEFIFEILMDYDNFYRLAGGIAETRLLEPQDDGIMLGYTRIDSCILFYCRQFEKVEKIQSTKPTEIVTEVIPERSDFKFNRTRWSFERTEGGTLVTYDAQMDPSFWIPPVIGPWAFKKKLRTSAEQIGYRIEYLMATGKTLSSIGN
jgi:hypothetical protein